MCPEYGNRLRRIFRRETEKLRSLSAGLGSNYRAGPQARWGVFRPALVGSVTDSGLDYTYGPCDNAAFPDCSFPHNSCPHDCLAMS
jgi:hypothetical protein